MNESDIESDSVERRLPPVAPAAGFWSERGLSDLALLALTVAALLLCYLIVRPFVTSLAWAVALAVIGWPLHRWIALRVPHSNASAALSVIVLALLLIVPSGMIIPGAINEALSGYKVIRAQIESNAWNETLARHAWIAPAWEWIRLRLDLSDLLQRAGAALTAIGSYTVRSSFVGTIEFVLTFFFLFYFLRDRDVLLARVRALLPTAPAETERLLRVVSDTVFATVYGKVLVGIVQGTLGGFMFWWLDLPAAWFWGIVMGLLSIIPLLGAPLVWIPAALLLLLDGAWGRSLLLALWGTAVVGLADNLLYPIIVGKHLRLHTVPLLISLIGGVVVFGAVGFFVGPVVLAVTLAALDIWRARSGPG